VRDRSWEVLTLNGTIDSAAAPDIMARSPSGRRGPKVDTTLLARLAVEIVQGTQISKLTEIINFKGISSVIERNRIGSRIGKVVAE